MTAGCGFLTGWPAEKRGQILNDYEIARAVANKEGSAAPDQEAAAKIILRHGLAAELGLDYLAAALMFASALLWRAQVIQWLLSPRAIGILYTLRGRTGSEDSACMGIGVERLLEMSLTACLHAEEPSHPLVADYAARYAAEIDADAEDGAIPPAAVAVRHDVTIPFPP